MMKKNIVCILGIFFLFVSQFETRAQLSFKIGLFDSADSTPIAFARIEDLKSNKIYRSDINGEVSLWFKKLPTVLHLDIRYISYKGSLDIETNGISEKKIYLNKQGFELQEAKIKGLSAKEIMLNVVAKIPYNYIDSSFLLLGNFRQYHRINGKYKNLIEAQMGIANKVFKKENELKTKESYAIIQLRRSHYYYPVDNYLSDDISDLMSENPVYHLLRNSLNPRIFDEYDFRFDTTSFFNKQVYTIHYKNRSLPVERHSIEGYENGFFSGEAFEEGYFVVDKESFALVEMERISTRNPGYNYPQNNNYVLPNRKYTVEFAGAHLKLKFEKKDNKWFVKEMYHQFTHDFFDASMGIKRYRISEFFEWNTLIATRVLPKELENDFFETTALSLSEYTYQKEAWESLKFDSYYAPKEKLYEEIGRVIPLETQFLNKTTEYEK